METNRTPFNSLSGFDQISQLTTMVRQAYFRRSRQLPANLADMVECLRKDILKHLGAIPVDVLDQAITTSTLNDTETPLSVAFFFSAASKRWYQPKTNLHHWDEDPDRRPDVEQDTLNLLDTLCANIRKSWRTYFDAHREYSYLVMRKQIHPELWKNFKDRALVDINTERMREHMKKVDGLLAVTEPDVVSQAKRLAVIDWLHSCVIRETLPSKLITPEETSYSIWRKSA